MKTPLLEKKITAARALQLLNIFRELDNDMPIGECVSLAIIAAGETMDGGGMGVTDLSVQGGFSLAAASRYAQHLGSKGRKGGPGYGLISRQVCLEDSRSVTLKLTAKGENFLQKIRRVVG